MRLRPILMTSFAFILGCVPLWTAAGSGAASRRILGTVVITGMLAATLVAVFLIPLFFVLFERLALKLGGRSRTDDRAGAGGERVMRWPDYRADGSWRALTALVADQRGRVHRRAELQAACHGRRPMSSAAARRAPPPTRGRSATSHGSTVFDDEVLRQLVTTALGAEL